MTDDKERDMECEGVDIDFPRWMIREIEQRSAHIGVTPQDLIKYWIGERLAKQSEASH